MKKLLSLLLAFSLLFTLSGCAFIAEEDVDYEQVGSFLEDVLSDLTEETTVAPVEPSADPEETEETTDFTVEETLPTEETTGTTIEETTPYEDPAPDEDGTYTSKDDVAAYIYYYGHLPQNFITKKQARSLGWKSGSLEKYAPGKCIGGDHFGNYEGLLPKAPGRKYTECDIDTLHANSRGAKRIVFSNDGLIYYTDDHYESFTLLYGEE